MAALAQFDNFAVTDDGKRLYFTTALITGSEDSRSKIYRTTDSGVELFKAPGPPNDSLGPQAVGPLTSGDGTIAGYGIYQPCRTGSCGFFALPRTSFTIEGTELKSIPYDAMQISRNGQYLLGLTFDFRLNLIEVPSRKTRQFAPNIFRAGPQSVADSGAFLARGGPANTPLTLLYVPLNEEPRPIPGTENPMNGILSPDGSVIAYERVAGNEYQLVLTNTQGESHRVIATAPKDLAAADQVNRFGYKASFSNDSTLLFLQPDSEGRFQPWIYKAGRGGPELLVEIASGVRALIISGDARVVWIGTGRGQLLSVDIGSRNVSEVIPETPFLWTLTTQGVPGSVLRLYGSGLSEKSVVSIGETRLPVTEFSASATAPLKFGTSGRNLIQSPAWWNFDLSAFKNFHFTERVYLQLRGEAFNGLNNVQFFPPDLNVASPNFGTLQSANRPRVMQVALRVVF
jgi:hypothetical protein